MLKRLLQRFDSFLIGGTLIGPLKLFLDRIAFYSFFKFYYKKRFKYYGDNIFWGKDFKYLCIPQSVRISCPEKIIISNNVRIDEGVYLQCDAGVANDVAIYLGEYVRINAHTHVLAGSKITIEKEVLIAPFCLISSNNHRSEFAQSIMSQGMKESGPIHIEQGVWIGQNAKILGDVRIGKFSVVGTGAIASKNNFPIQSKIISSKAVCI